MIRRPPDDVPRREREFGQDGADEVGGIGICKFKVQNEKRTIIFKKETSI